MRTAALVNFFNVPMIVPTAGGDNIFPSNNLWAFRLSAPGSQYANYLFGSLLENINAVADEDVAFSPKLRIAILYEQNTFGESAAVATARAAMQQGTEIGVYESFPQKYADPALLNRLIHKVRDAGDIHLVVLVSSEPATAITLTQLFHNQTDYDQMPVLIGQAGGFASQEFIDSESADDIYIIHQQVILKDCPSGIESLFEAQTYAAAHLLNLTMEQIKEIRPEKNWYEITNQEEVDISFVRENLRDAIKLFDGELPCVGQVSFDNRGQNKDIQFDLIFLDHGEMNIGPTEEFISSLKSKMDPFQ